MKKMRAFISVTDKNGLEKFKAWTDAGHEIVSTGGTYKRLKELGIPCIPVEDVTGFPEILGGRVKSMHPKITGAMLGDTYNPDHIDQMNEHGIVPFDLVVVNLYNFNERPSIENIDVGGPTALRSAAKNLRPVLMNPNKYEEVIERLIKNGRLDLKEREGMAIDVFEATSYFDKNVQEWLVFKWNKNESFVTTPSLGH